MAIPSRLLRMGAQPLVRVSVIFLAISVPNLLGAFKGAPFDDVEPRNLSLHRMSGVDSWRRSPGFSLLSFLALPKANHVVQKYISRTYAPQKTKIFPVNTAGSMLARWLL